MTISRPLAWCLLVLTVIGASLIRQLNEFVPEWAPLPWPVRSPLYMVLVALFLVFLATPSGRRGGSARGPGKGVALGALVPLLIALVYEKILSVTLYDALLDHAVGVGFIRNHLDSWIHLIIGVGMTTAVLLLLPLMRGVRYGQFLGGARLRSALYLQFFALLTAYALILGLVSLVGGRSVRPVVFFPMGAGAVMLLAGQGLRAMAEEFYYRGLLQRELQSLMEDLGVRASRSGQALAVGLISLGFGLEHFRFGAPLVESYRGFAYAVAAGFLFGYLLILTGNVFFCGLAHATNNFVTAGLMPQLGSSDGTLSVPAEPILYIYLIAVFLLIFLLNAAPKGNLRRAFLPDSDSPLAAGSAIPE